MPYGRMICALSEGDVPYGRVICALWELHVPNDLMMMK